MSITISKIALAVAAAVVSAGAQATLVTFDDLWAANENTPKPVTTIPGTGLTFSGATAYQRTMLGAEDGAIPALRSSESGFVLNRAPRKLTGCGTDSLFPCDPEASTPITITLGANQFFSSVNFEYATSGISNLLFGKIGAADPILSDQLTAGFGVMAWGQRNSAWTFTNLQDVNRIEFAPVSGAILALDTMTFEIRSTGTPPPAVPEPASYGLVGVAMLAAGAASRRRRQA